MKSAPLPFPQRVLDDLLREYPSFHGPDGSFQWSLGQDALRWLLDATNRGDRTLETGCGYSTVLFAAKGACHTVISPLSEEHRRIREWSEGHGVGLSSVTFMAQKSENVLPFASSEPLDLVLIDGWHAFPAPFLDWFFTCQKLVVGGRMVIDDTQIHSCRILRNFLELESGRWKLEGRFGRTDVFRKLRSELFEGDWRSQPWGSKPLIPVTDRLRTQVRPQLVKFVAAIPGLKRALKTLRSKIIRRDNL
jgi:hypothetical protein